MGLPNTKGERSKIGGGNRGSNDLFLAHSNGHSNGPCATCSPNKKCSCRYFCSRLCAPPPRGAGMIEIFCAGVSAIVIRGV